MMNLREAIRKTMIEYYQPRGSRNLKQLSSLGNILEKHIGSSTELSSIDDAYIDKLMTKLLKAKNSNATINRKLSLLSKVLGLAVFRWKELDKMPIIERLPETPSRIACFSQQEEQDIIMACEDTVFQEFITILFGTGFRNSELTGLQLAPVDVDIIRSRERKRAYGVAEADVKAGTITVWGSVSGTRSGSKTGNTRTIPMTIPVQTILSKYYKLGVKTPFDISDYYINRQWLLVRNKLGRSNDSGFIPYTIRHTVATRLWEKSGDIYLVKTWLGHSSIKTTERYTHVSGSKLMEAKKYLD
jgi:integrase